MDSGNNQIAMVLPEVLNDKQVFALMCHEYLTDYQVSEFMKIYNEHDRIYEYLKMFLISNFLSVNDFTNLLDCYNNLMKDTS